MNSASISVRAIASLGGNVLRNVLSMFAGLLIARGLGPSDYGNLTFLLGSFLAIRQLLDLGSSSAFYTLLSQQPRGRQFYLSYFGWMAAQFLVTVLVVAVLLPRPILDRLWLGHARGLVVLACVASFLQQHVWQTVGQIGEAARQTVRVQALNLAVGVLHVALLAVLLSRGWMGVPVVLGVYIVEYLVAAGWAYRLLRPGFQAADRGAPARGALRRMVNDYRAYCAPLVLYSFIGCAYEFGDRWMLQYFGGSAQQGFYQLGYQCSSVSLIATASVLKIFWKEIAESDARQDRERVRRLYRKASRGLVMVGALLSGFLIPWSKALLVLVFGRAYAAAWPVLAVMFLYPVAQALGQISGTMFLATGKTRTHVIVGTIFMVVSLPVSYLMQAPRDALVPGLGLGSMGMALKMVVLGMIGANVMAWLIARMRGWSYDWTYQLVGITALVAMGFLAQQAVGVVWDVHGEGVGLVWPIACSGMIYLAAAAGLIWTMPWLVGVEHAELTAMGRRLRGLLWPRRQAAEAWRE